LGRLCGKFWIFEQNDEQKDTIKCCHWAKTTNIGLLYPNVRNNIGGDIPNDVTQPKYWRGCVPGIPGGVDASG